MPFWSALGKAEMLKAFLALDQIPLTLGQGGGEAQLQRVVKHMTLSLAYDALVAESYFELARAEEGLHKRIIQDGLSIKMLHEYAQRAAEAQELEQPTRFQQFLDRMFGAATLWA